MELIVPYMNSSWSKPLVCKEGNYQLLTANIQANIEAFDTQTTFGVEYHFNSYFAFVQVSVLSLHCAKLNLSIQYSISLCSGCCQQLDTHGKGFVPLSGANPFALQTLLSRLCLLISRDNIWFQARLNTMGVLI